MAYIIPVVKLLSPNQYVREATAATSRAKSRVYVASMVLANHEATRPLIESLKAAAERGVKVVVSADIFTYGEVSGGFLPIRYYSLGVKDTNRMVKLLKEAGVEFDWFGRGRMTFFNGRTHSKWLVADDEVFTFGGVNLYEDGIRHTDYMFQTEDGGLADRIADEHERIRQAEKRFTNFRSSSYKIEQSDVLFDGGIVGRSIIYDRAVKLAREADEVVFVSQYCPTGKLARALKNKPAKIYYNRPTQTTGLNRFAITVSQRISGLKTAYEGPRYIHAKFIIYKLPDGSKVALSGSHNFAYTGVLLGTREVAIETKNPEIIDQLEKFLAKEIYI